MIGKADNKKTPSQRATNSINNFHMIEFGYRRTLRTLQSKGGGKGAGAVLGLGVGWGGALRAPFEEMPEQLK